MTENKRTRQLLPWVDSPQVRRVALLTGTDLDRYLAAVLHLASGKLIGVVEPGSSQTTLIALVTIVTGEGGPDNSFIMAGSGFAPNLRGPQTHGLTHIRWAGSAPAASAWTPFELRWGEIGVDLLSCVRTHDLWVYEIRGGEVVAVGGPAGPTGDPDEQPQPRADPGVGCFTGGRIP